MLTEAKEERARALKNQISAIFTRYGVDRVPPEEAARLKPLIDEFKSITEEAVGHSLGQEFKQMQDLWEKPEHPMIHDGRGGGGDGESAPYSGESLGRLFVKSPACLSYSPTERRGPAASFPVKALLSTVEWVPESIRLPRVEAQPSRPLSILDALSVGSTNQNAVVYLEESTATNAAVEVGEGLEKPESTLIFTERTAPVRTIATLLPVTTALLEDVQAARGYIDARLAYFVRARLDSQIVNGTGVAPDLRGILNTPSVQSQAKGADPTPDCIGKAADLVRQGGGYEPDFVLLAPADWQDIRHLRTADGVYLWGSPSDTGAKTIWGMRVYVSSAVPAGTGVVGARQAAMIFFRSDVTLAISDSHEDFFVKNKVMVRAEIRAAFAVFRPEALCLCTGL